MGKDSYKNILQENYEIWDCFCQSLFGIQGYDRQCMKSLAQYSVDVKKWQKHF